MPNLISFNIDAGNLEAIVHGYKDGFLRPEEYNNLCQCDTLGDLKSQLQVTEYGTFLQNEPSVTARVIVDKATEKLVHEFLEIREGAGKPLSTFLDFITYEHMINNVLKLITSKRSGRDTLDLLKKCHPLGDFPGLSALPATSGVDEMFEVVLVDSPIGRFFTSNTQKKDFDELSVEYIRGLLHKNYLEAFYDLCSSIGGDTAMVMCPLLEFEADRLVVTITANTCGLRDLNAGDRRKLYPNIGSLLDLHDDLANTETEDQLKDKLRRFVDFADLFDDSRAGIDATRNKKSVERKFVEKAVDRYRDAMTRQFQYGVFYGWIKLKELEISNLQWIADCVAQQMKGHVHEFVPL